MSAPGRIVDAEYWKERALINEGCADFDFARLILSLSDEAKDAATLRAKYARAVHALQDIAALKPKPKTSGKEIAIHALAMIGEPREEIS